MTDREERKKNITHILILMIAAFIWGTAFVAQTRGAQYLDAFTFNAARTWFAVLFLIPVIKITDRISYNKTGKTNAPAGPAEKKAFIAGGIVCGAFLCGGTLFQQVGIRYTTTAKAGFITALYILIVPLICVFMKKMPGIKVWAGVALGIAGLYLLSIKGREGLAFGDAMMVICAFFFAFQILSANHFLKTVHPLRLCCAQMFVSALISSIISLSSGLPDLHAIAMAMPSILYAGVLSGGVAYTLQLVGQKDINTTVASLTMSLESVFSALAGWAVLGQMLTGRELAGCVIMFLAIIISQL